MSQERHLPEHVVRVAKLLSPATSNTDTGNNTTIEKIGDNNARMSSAKKRRMGRKVFNGLLMILFNNMFTVG